MSDRCPYCGASPMLPLCRLEQRLRAPKEENIMEHPNPGRPVEFPPRWEDKPPPDELAAQEEAAHGEQIDLEQEIRRMTDLATDARHYPADLEELITDVERAIDQDPLYTPPTDHTCTHDGPMVPALVSEPLNHGLLQPVVLHDVDTKQVIGVLIVGHQDALLFFEAAGRIMADLPPGPLTYARAKMEENVLVWAAEDDPLGVLVTHLSLENWP